MPTRNAFLSEQFDTFIAAGIEEGRCSNASEVVGEGLRLVQQRDSEDRAVAGVAASFGLARLLSTFLFGVKPWDPAVLISAPLVLTAIALLAVWLPATRASKVNPMQALRAE